MIIELLQPKDEEGWDKFILNSEDSTFCHLLGWREVIKESYGHRDFYLVAKEGKAIKGILPIFALENFFFGRKLFSMPFCIYGGVVAEKKQAVQELIDYAKKYTKDKNYDHLVLRSFASRESLVLGYIKSTFLLNLEPGEKFLWQNLDKKLRNQLRKAMKFSFQVRVGKTIKELKDFYCLYQQTMKRVGTPVHSFEFFKNILEEFNQAVTIFLVYYQGRPASALFFFGFKNKAINLFGASDPHCWKLNINDFIYWQAIKYFLEKKFSIFDFGSSEEGTGTWHFKKQWGGKEKKILYQYYSSRGESLGSPRKKYGGGSRLWKKMPLFLANFLGPHLRKYVP